MTMVCVSFFLLCTGLGPSAVGKSLWRRRMTSFRGFSMSPNSIACSIGLLGLHVWSLFFPFDSSLGPLPCLGSIIFFLSPFLTLLFIITYYHSLGSLSSICLLYYHILFVVSVVVVVGAFCIAGRSAVRRSLSVSLVFFTSFAFVFVCQLGF